MGYRKTLRITRERSSEPDAQMFERRVCYSLMNIEEKLAKNQSSALFRSSEFVTTDTELSAIAPPAIMGFSIIPNE